MTCPDKRVLTALLSVALSGCGDSGGPSPPPLPITLPAGFTVEVFASGLQFPTSIAFPPDGSNRLFVNELQSGRVRIVQDGVLLPQPFAQVVTNTTGTFPVEGENGLLGIAVDPQYAINRYVYVTFATRTDTGTFATVARFTDVNNHGEDFTVLLDGIPSAPGHQIESLVFGPDGMLYVSTGDAFLADQAQDPDSFPGKILRMQPDGGLPGDNPFPGSYTYAYGFRNCFDLVFDAAGELFSTDNGPDRDDELNRIVAGGNYGWPVELGETTDPAYVTPLHVWSQIVAPGGMAFYTGTEFPAAFRGKLFVVLFGGTFSQGPSDRAKRVQVVDLTSTPPRLEDFAVYAFAGIGNPLDLAQGPDGSLFLSDIFQGRIYRITYTG
ncbi:MAG: PQQ-dependent sugar dehydrogenase [Gemmatimonadales bacterium]